MTRKKAGATSLVTTNARLQSSMPELLSVEFLQANGITANKPLKNWIVRAAFLAKTRNTADEKTRYERWALHTIEETISNSRGVNNVDWRNISPVMPPDAPDYNPLMLKLKATEEAKSCTNTVTTFPVNDANERQIRQNVWEESHNRAPAELMPFIVKAFELYDKEVNLRKRSYAQVSMIQMLNIAKNLRTREEKLISLQKQSKPEKTMEPVNMNGEYKPIRNVNNETNSKISSTLSEVYNNLSVKKSNVRRYENLSQSKIYSKLEKNFSLTPSATVITNSVLSTTASLPPFSPTSTSATSATSTSLSTVKSNSSTVIPDKLANSYITPPTTFTPLLSVPITEQEKYVKLSNKRPRNKVANMFDMERAFFSKAVTTSLNNEFKEHAKFAMSKSLERIYSRYEPKMEDIRPLSVLKKALKFIRKRTTEKERTESRVVSLKYLSDQLKGIRQDLRVQNIINNFTIRVYEEHATLSLETGELGEFNQCQASLKQFYNNVNIHRERCHIREFFSYRLLYLYLSQQYDALSTELITWTNAHDSSHCVHRKHCEECANVQHILRLCKACDDGDCRSVLHELEHFAVSMWFLLKIFLEKLRVRWLHQITIALRGKVSMQFVLSSLGFLPVIDNYRQVPNSIVSEMSLRIVNRTCNDVATDDCNKIHERQKEELVNSETITNNKNTPLDMLALDSAKSYKSLQWLDKSHQGAANAVESLFSLIKLKLPDNFNFDDEVNYAIEFYEVNKCSGNTTNISPDCHLTFLDVALARQSTELYLQFLTTRKDAMFA